jgi:hypothetical protein
MRDLVFGAQRGGKMFALFLLVFSGTGIAQLDSKGCQADRPAYLTRNR